MDRRRFIGRIGTAAAGVAVVGVPAVLVTSYPGFVAGSDPINNHVEMVFSRTSIIVVKARRKGFSGMTYYNYNYGKIIGTT